MNSNFHQNGFSLIEMLVVVFILAFGFAALAKLQVSQMSDSSFTRQYAVAAMLSQEKIEQLRLWSEAPNINNGAVGQTFVGIRSGVLPETVINGVPYTTQWTVTVDAALPYKNIVVTTHWVDQSNQTLSVNLETRIGNSDPVNAGKLLSGAASILTL